MMPTQAFPIQPEEFRGKRALVTGGSQGMGAAVVRRLTQGERRWSRRRERRPRSPSPKATFISADLTTAEGCERVIQETLSQLGGADILVNVLGGSSAPGGGFAALSDQEWQKELNLNLFPAVRLDRGFLPSMLRQKSGAIIHVSSLQRRFPLYEATLAYAASKAALTTYSKGLSKEVGPNGVRVNSVAPGFIETKAAEALIGRLSATQGTDLQATRQGLMNSIGGIPIGRTGGPRRWRSSSPSSSPIGPPRSPGANSPLTAARCRPSSHASRPHKASRMTRIPAGSRSRGEGSRCSQPARRLKFRFESCHHGHPKSGCEPERSGL